MDWGLIGAYVALALAVLAEVTVIGGAVYLFIKLLRTPLSIRWRP
jgi:hypothetical protein